MAHRRQTDENLGLKRVRSGMPVSTWDLENVSVIMGSFGAVV